ncbi:hypothetical protein BDV96DRAFT_50306 [Lophiotrema nucula]|uniref:Uncharacterized protein n=1 Tax=Lophiotrema nucula TaxID=690887 RepID=A0A6A5ZD35_9PLEO|nr:hypothetical protein BDV96DRAFT_50306 [Lophiotrema nucula]
MKFKGTAGRCAAGVARTHRRPRELTRSRDRSGPNPDAAARLTRLRRWPTELVVGEQRGHRHEPVGPAWWSSWKTADSKTRFSRHPRPCPHRRALLTTIQTEQRRGDGGSYSRQRARRLCVLEGQISRRVDTPSILHRLSPLQVTDCAGGRGWCRDSPDLLPARATDVSGSTGRSCRRRSALAILEASIDSPRAQLLQYHFTQRSCSPSATAPAVVPLRPSSFTAAPPCASSSLPHPRLRTDARGDGRCVDLGPSCTALVTEPSGRIAHRDRRAALHCLLSSPALSCIMLCALCTLTTEQSPLGRVKSGRLVTRPIEARLQAPGSRCLDAMLLQPPACEAVRLLRAIVPDLSVPSPSAKNNFRQYPQILLTEGGNASSDNL